MNKKELTDSITVGITGYKDSHWKSKLSEIEKLKIDKASLFLERFTKLQRKKIYKALLNSRVREIPLIHIRNDIDRGELSFLAKKYNKPYFTIHENSFNYLKKWRGYYKNLYLEMDYNNSISRKVDVGKIGGFCIDLAHFKASEERWAKEFLYEFKKNKKNYFKCNHLSGYSFGKNCDIHLVKKSEDFDYLKTLPGFLFGNVMAMEIDNSIAEQLKFKNYIIKLLNIPKNLKIK